MKAFFNKIKNSNKVLLALYLISLIAYAVSYVLLTINLLHLSTIETPIRIVAIVIFGIWLIIWLLSGLISLFTKKYKPYVILIVFTILFTIIFSFGNYYIGTLYSGIESISKDKLTYTSNLINLKESTFDKDSKIGMINDPEDIEGYILGNKLVKENKLSNEIKRYDDYFMMVHDLYDKKIDAIIVSGNYIINFSSEEEFENIENDTKIVHTYSEEMDNVDNVSYTDKKLTEPFTVLLMGVDSTIDGLNANQAFNGDTLMLASFNPKTLTASVFSIPRDTYVPIACRNNAWAKINSSAASGTNCVIKTVKNLTDIDIDFYVKVNFKGVVDLVEALGGITVDVQKPDFMVREGVNYHGQVCEQNSLRQFGNHMVCMDSGVQRLNGEQALAYSRSRKQFLRSDLDRVLHQQQVVSAIANEVKNIRSFEQFETILKAVEKNMDTNMKSDQIMSLYNVAKKIVMNSLNGVEEPVSINKTFLETYNLPVWQGYSNTSALGYYQDSMDEISEMFKVNLEKQKPKIIKNYKIDYNEDYKAKYFGQGLTSKPIEKIMANLIGQTKEQASSWCTSNGLTPSIKYVSEGDEFYDSNIPSGYVANQSLHVNTLINNLTQVTLYVINSTNKPSTPTTDDNPTSSTDNNNVKPKDDPIINPDTQDTDNNNNNNEDNNTPNDNPDNDNNE